MKVFPLRWTFQSLDKVNRLLSLVWMGFMQSFDLQRFKSLTFTLMRPPTRLPSSCAMAFPVFLLQVKQHISLNLGPDGLLTWTTPSALLGSPAGLGTCHPSWWYEPVFSRYVSPSNIHEALYKHNGNWNLKVVAYFPWTFWRLFTYSTHILHFLYSTHTKDEEWIRARGMTELSRNIEGVSIF